MSEIINRAARAIYEASPHNKPFSLLTAFQRERLTREARAAIAAMREPTNEMVEAAQRADAYWHHDIGEIVSEWREEMRKEYRAMIDAALTPSLEKA